MSTTPVTQPTRSAHTVHELPLAALHPHPMNANRMPPALLAKLRAHVEATGSYEPLIVRPHPTIERAWQLINGHHRAQILRELNHATAACLIWHLTDAQTLLLLATINRLEGADAPSRRLALLEALAAEIPIEELKNLLPEDGETLGRLLAGKEPPAIAAAPDLAQMLEPFTIFLPAVQKARLKAALRQTDENPAVAIMRWVEDHGRVGAA